MKQKKSLEAAVGAFVVLGIVGLIFLAYDVSQVDRVGHEGNYTVYASFATVSGLKKGASVDIAGVKVGQVTDITINAKTFEAQVTIAIDKHFQYIPDDSSISVLTQGLLGEKYLGIDIGASDTHLAQGDDFQFTKSSLVLERLVDKFLLKNTEVGNK